MNFVFFIPQLVTVNLNPPQRKKWQGKIFGRCTKGSDNKDNSKVRGTVYVINTKSLTLFRMESKKHPTPHPYQFFPLASTNAGISLKNF